MATMQKVLSEVRELTADEWKYVGGGATTSDYGPTMYEVQRPVMTVIAETDGQQIWGYDDYEIDYEYD